ncbi:MAG: hypothetical protein NVS3B10_02240 [Polyangiales bacterium]
MSDTPHGGGAASDPVVSQLLEWRRHPTPEATITLCAELEARPSIDFVALVAQVVAKEHWDVVEVVRALARLQIRAGLHSQGRRTMLRAAKLEAAGKPAPVFADRRYSQDSAATHEHAPPQLLLDLLRGIDDDEAIQTIARRVTSRPPHRTRSSARRIAALGGISRTIERLERSPIEVDVVPDSHRSVSSSPPPPPPAPG